MNPLIALAAFLISYNLLLVNADKYVVVRPNHNKQIRRSPAIPQRSFQVSASASYPHHSPPPFNHHYGSFKSRATLPAHNQIHHGIKDIAPSQNGHNYPSMPYGKSPVIYPFPYSAKLYPQYPKYKGGFVPLSSQNRYLERYPVETSRPRPQVAPIYAGTMPPANFYPSRPIVNDAFILNKNSPARLQPIERPQPIFTGQHQQYHHQQQQQQQRPFIGNPEDPVKNAQQSLASSPFPSKVSPFVVKAPPLNYHQQQQQQQQQQLQEQATRNGDLAKDSSNVVGKVPPASTIGANSGQFVIRDTVLLDDYEKKIAEFTKSWPKLSAFPGAYSSSNNLFPGSSSSSSSFEPITSPSVVSRSSDTLGTINTTSRKGYEVKEDIDEPPFDYRSLSANTLSGQQYPSMQSASLTKNLYVSN